MPELSRLKNNIVIRMITEEIGQHNKSHIHVKYAEFQASYDLDGNLLAGNLPAKQAKIVEGWIALREEELKEAWNKIVKGENFGKIEP